MQQSKATPHPNALKHDVHILPKPACSKRHVANLECWCSPYRDPTAPLMVIHNRRNPLMLADGEQDIAS